MTRKIGFWAVFALVTGSQIGSGIFMLPIILAPFGALSITGWCVSGIGAICLSLVFAKLCSWFPKTGGPHIYVHKAFGEKAAYLTGWTYWLISWFSSTAVIIASVGYLTPLLGYESPYLHLCLEIALLVIITGLNFKGVKAAGNAEFVLTLIKIIPLFILPIMALGYFDAHHFAQETVPSSQSPSSMLSQVVVLTFWGFIGVESATAPAESVENPSKTIPRALILGTISVAALYLMNSVGIMGIIPAADLAQAKAPYSDAAQIIFGGNWHLGISLLAAIICIGTLNAWTLTSGQIALGLAQDGLLPAFFGKKNKEDAPVVALAISCGCTIPILILSSSAHMAKQMSTFIDFSVISFLFIYAFCCLAFLKLSWQNKELKQYSFWVGLVALGFCLWIIWETPAMTLLIASSFTAVGIPVYFLRHRKKMYEC